MRILLIVTLFAFLSGCGYSLGTLGHPQIDSIAVAPSVNETIEPNVVTWMRQYCGELIQTDGTYQLLPMEKANCVLYTRVVSINSYEEGSTSTDNEARFRSRASLVVLICEYSVIIPGKVTPIMGGTVRSTALYQTFLDQEKGRQAAIKDACRRASLEIVKKVAENW